MRKFLLIGFAFLIFATPALAVSDNNSEKTETRKEERQTFQEEKKQIREQYKKESRELREEKKASFSALKEQYKTELLKIRNEKKRVIVEKFTEKMNQVSQRRVEHWNKILARLNEILTKIDSINHGPLVDEKIDIAKAKLATAQAAVDAQANKTYTVTIASESGLKSNAGEAMKSEQSDLRQIVFLINDAKKSVHDALRALKQEHGLGEGPTGTVSATPSITPSLTPTTTVTPTSSPSATPI